MASEAKFNITQQNKTPGYLSNFVARPGHKLVQCDLSSIEPRIITHFSQDTTLLSIYGPGAKPNDVYLKNAAHVPLFADEVRKYYDPDNPTVEMVTEAKKQLKKIRSLMKVATLLMGYGGGWRRLQLSLATAGHVLPDCDVKLVHSSYWELYGGIKRLQKQLEDMWTSNGGWFPNIAGRPVCVAHEFLHDACNRMAQSSGHDVLRTWIYYIQKLRVERGVVMLPWLVDFHDETIWECPEHEAERVKQVLIDALKLTDEEYDLTVRLEGDPMIADNLAQIKVENYDEWLAAQ